MLAGTVGPLRVQPCHGLTLAGRHGLAVVLPAERGARLGKRSDRAAAFSSSGGRARPSAASLPANQDAPSLSISSKGPSSHPNPHRITRSTSSGVVS